MADAFRDFIPEGQDPGALGKGFTDFVAAKEPVKTVEEVVTLDVVETNETFTCEQCGFTTESKSGFSSHVRSHK